MALRIHKGRPALWAAIVLAGVVFCLPACESSGHFTLLGYTTQPNYDCNIHTVYVPIFENRTFRKGIEFDLTQAVVRAIEQYTPYKVVCNCDHADTELLGKIVAINKQILNRNQLNEVREAETVLTVEVIWRDRRTGEVLTGPARQPGQFIPPAPFLDMESGPPQPVALGPGAPPGALPMPKASETPPAAPPPVPGVLPPPPPALVSSYSTFIPEVGGSITTSEKGNIDKLAVQIVSMMEKPW
jgi:hypothetical protein